MALTKRRPSAAASISKAAIEQATASLEQLPERPKQIRSLREAIALLQDSISEAIARGYSHEEIAEILSQKGVKTTASSLKRYLAVARREKTGGSTKPRTRRSKKTSDVEAELLAATPVIEPAAEEEEAPAPKRRGGRTAKSTTSTRGTKSAAKAAPKSTATKTASRSTTTTRRRRK